MQPSAQIPFNISSITPFERLVTIYSAESISSSNADNPLSSAENWCAEPLETCNARLMSFGVYSELFMKCLRYPSVSKIGTLSIRRTRVSERSVSIGLGISVYRWGWQGVKTVTLSYFVLRDRDILHKQVAVDFCWS